MCPLWIGSYGYALRDLRYEWRKHGSVSIDEMTTSQFLITEMEQGVTNNLTNRLTEYGFRNDSVAFLHFFLERQMGFFLLQVHNWKCSAKIVQTSLKIIQKIFLKLPRLTIFIINQMVISNRQNLKSASVWFFRVSERAGYDHSESFI